MQSPQHPSLIICSTKRIARSLQLAHQAEQQAKGLLQWQPLNVQTLDQWLEAVFSDALLTGEIDTQYAPSKKLSQLEERLIWQHVIGAKLKQRDFADLFDLKGLADTCVEANRYMVAWQLNVSEDDAIAEETREFLIWQHAFQARCEHFKGLEEVRYFDWQITCLEKGAGALPNEITFAGFDQTAPQEVKLRRVLQGRGCTVYEHTIGLDQAGATEQVTLQDEVEEIRTMVAWAKRAYDANPKVKLAMVVPQLKDLRNQISDLIDDVFQPEAIRPSLVEAPRLYNFSLGLPLVQQPVIQTALNLLRMFFSRDLNQPDISELLLSNYWSASEREADHRALLDAKMREFLPQQLYWGRLLKFIHRQSEKLNLTQLIQHITQATAYVAEQPTRQMPSAWAHAFVQLLEYVAWSGERVDSSHEYQAKESWAKALQAFSQLDFLGDKMTASAACALLQQICQEQVFQPETTGEPTLHVLGIMEALSEPVDAMWCMGMNDSHWPMPARPNPLLPAHIQRAARVANSDSAVQTEFANAIHQRLIHSANTIIFSSSLQSGEKTLRVSPLMQTIPVATADYLPADTLAEVFAKVEQQTVEWLADDTAPAVQEGEHVHGGTGLIRAQAICPAWAFHQFRLGAKALRSPKSGLDAAERGQLVHGALEAFWRNGETFRHYADLIQMSEESLSSAISEAADISITEFKQTHGDIFSPNTLMLEHERLSGLLTDWLAFEKTHEVKFTLDACEVEKLVNINGIEVTLKIDRIHALENGGLEIVDYKTGQVPKMKSWGEERITEPQLPIYAVFYEDFENEIAGVQFGMVKTKDHNYTGISALNFEAEPEKRKPSFTRAFEDWESLKIFWKTQIENIVLEIKEGQAPVVFENAADMLYCEVLPLLRLPERQLQFERQLSDHNGSFYDGQHND